MLMWISKEIHFSLEKKINSVLDDRVYRVWEFGILKDLQLNKLKNFFKKDQLTACVVCALKYSRNLKSEQTEITQE